jgi:hypothetical protein
MCRVLWALTKKILVNVIPMRGDRALKSGDVINLMNGAIAQHV